MSVNNTTSVAVLPPEARKQEIPYLVMWLLLGAQIHEKYKGGDGYALELEGEFREVAEQDLATAFSVRDEITHFWLDRMPSGKQLLDIHKFSAQIFLNMEEKIVKPGKKIVMLKDKGGAGYWRMVLPARYLERLLSETSDGAKCPIRIDVTGAGVKFDYLMEYDTIYVQRLHDWESFYVLEKLKKIGRRIVYDMDDDIFSLTPDNPAFHFISRDNQMAAVACMKLADVVTTTTAVLQHRLAQVLDGIWPEVIPNALDVDDGWPPTALTGSPDGLKRIFWQGSATHAEDWEVCIGAVDRIMQEYPNVHLVLLGFLPPVVIERLQTQPHWKGKVEHLGFNDVETYFQIVKHVRAEVGIAPLAPKTFNQGKSPIKFLEYTCTGMPTVASAMEPYASAIKHGENGYLASPDLMQWYSCIKACLDNPPESKKMVEAARQEVRECYDIKKVVQCWQKVLLPSCQPTTQAI